MGYTYVISDIHGHYDLFIKLLENIGFSDEDKLYILGDMIDKGNKSIEILNYIINKTNVYAVIGNHEYEFLKYYDHLMQDYDGNDIEILDKLKTFFGDDRLTWEIVDYLDNLPSFVESDCFIGVHAGFALDENNVILPLDRQNLNKMVNDRFFKSREVINPFGKPVLFGHTPCCYENQTGEFIKTPNILSDDILDYNKIRLDTGASVTKMLGVLRIEDMKEIYVSEN